MKREDLQKIEGLTKEQIDSIMNLHQDDVNTWTTKLANKDTELKTEKGKVTTLTADLEKFKDVDIEELRNAKAQYDTEKEKMIDDHKKEISSLKFNSALELAVAGANTVDPVALRAHIDSSKLKYNEETNGLEGLEDQLNEIKDKHAYLFSTGATGESHGGIGGNEDKSVSLSGALTERFK